MVQSWVLCWFWTVPVVVCGLVPLDSTVNSGDKAVTVLPPPPTLNGGALSRIKQTRVQTNGKTTLHNPSLTLLPPLTLNRGGVKPHNTAKPNSAQSHPTHTHTHTHTHSTTTNYHQQQTQLCTIPSHTVLLPTNCLVNGENGERATHTNQGDKQQRWHPCLPLHYKQLNKNYKTSTTTTIYTNQTTNNKTQLCTIPSHTVPITTTSRTHPSVLATTALSAPLG